MTKSRGEDKKSKIRTFCRLFVFIFTTTSITMIEGVVDPAMVVPVGAEGCLTEFDVGKSITWILEDKKLGF